VWNAVTLPAGYETSYPDHVEPLNLEVVTLDEFCAIEEPGAEALVGDADGAVIPEGGDIMVYGDGGAGKTTLCIDLGCHLAAGDDWLGIRVARPARVLLVENEGPRPLFRAKLRRKRDSWEGSPLDDRVVVLETPWGRLSFSDPDWRHVLAAAIRDREIDVVIVGPVSRSGMNEAGTLQEVRDFMALVGEVRDLAGRRVAFVLVHHENKGGQVSGAWEGSGDTLFHVQPQGHGRTRLYVQKARWASAHHATTLHLVWTDGDGFAVEDKPELDDDTLAEQILTAIRESPGTGWTKIEGGIRGVGNDRKRAVRDELFAAGTILNVVKRDGTEVAIDHCPERSPARLHLADDPAISHLRQSSGAGPAQAAPAQGAGTEAPLRRAPRPIGGAGVAAQAAPSEKELEWR
jgi:hypothetical protein